MKCLSCDEILTNSEAVRKDKYGDFIDFCTDCIVKSDLIYNIEENIITLPENKDNDEST